MGNKTSLPTKEDIFEALDAPDIDGQVLLRDIMRCSKDAQPAILEWIMEYIGKHVTILHKNAEKTKEIHTLVAGLRAAMQRSA